MEADAYVCVYNPYMGTVTITGQENAAATAAYFRGVYPGKGKARLYRTRDEYMVALKASGEQYEQNCRKYAEAQI